MSSGDTQSVACPRCSARLAVAASRNSLCLCAGCGIQFRVGAPWPITRTSRRAVASMVLGFASLVGMFVTGIPAFLLGMWALSDMRSRRSPEILLGRGMATTGAVLGAFFSLLIFALPLLVMIPMREFEDRMRYMSQLRERVRVDVREGDFTKGASLYLTLVDMDPDHAMKWLRTATLQVRAGDQEAYQRLCGRMLDHFGETPSLGDAEKIAKACLLAPTNDSIVDDASRLADLATSDPEHWAILYSHMTQGLAEYRRGNYAKSVKSCQKCIDRDPEIRDQFRYTGAYLCLAMSQHQLGNAEEAAAALAKGRSFVEAAPQTTGDAWHDDLICRILLDEAEKLIQ